jgi:hypothetical protein
VVAVAGELLVLAVAVLVVSAQMFLDKLRVVELLLRNH